MRSRKIYVVHMNRKGAPDFSTALPVETKLVKYFDDDMKVWTVADVIVEHQAEPAPDRAWNGEREVE